MSQGVPTLSDMPDDLFSTSLGLGPTTGPVAARGTPASARQAGAAAAPSVATAGVGGEVEVRRSARRRRTISGFRENGRTVVVVPADLTAAEEEAYVARMVERLAVKDRARGADVDLLARARDLSGRYLEGRARPATVRWVTNQTTRWGSCTPRDGAIRLSHHLQGMPAWVVDYVLLHELAHLLVPSHGPSFWAVLARYPRTERARGFLQGVVHGARQAGVQGSELPPIGGENEECDLEGGDQSGPAVDPPA